MTYTDLLAAAILLLISWMIDLSYCKLVHQVVQSIVFRIDQGVVTNYLGHFCILLRFLISLLKLFLSF